MTPPNPQLVVPSPANDQTAELPAHDRIYALLVESEVDLVGLIAYSLYKRNKVAYIESFSQDRGRTPNEHELTEFRRNFALTATTRALRAEAEGILATFTGAILTQKLQAAETTYQDKISELSKAHSDDVIDKLSKAQPFWTGVKQNIIANVAVVVLSALMVALVWASKYGIVALIETVFDVKITPTSPS